MCALASLLLWEAVDGGDLLAVRRLLLKVSDVDATHRLTDYTALSVAAARGYTNIALLLLHAGASVDKRALSNGWGPLHCAVANGCVDVTAALLEAGADPCAIDKAGCTLLDLCRGNVVITSLLQAAALAASLKARCTKEGTTRTREQFAVSKPTTGLSVEASTAHDEDSKMKAVAAGTKGTKGAADEGSPRTVSSASLPGLVEASGLPLKSDDNVPAIRQKRTGLLARVWARVRMVVR